MRGIIYTHIWILNYYFYRTHYSMAVSFGYKNLITSGFEYLFGVSITEHTSNIVNRSVQC
jgi:hypothetical protein